MAKKDASIIHSLETNLKESKLVISKKDTSIKALTKKMRRRRSWMRKMPASMLLKVSWRRCKLQINLMEKDDAIKTLMRQLEEKNMVTI